MRPVLVLAAAGMLLAGAAMAASGVDGVLQTLRAQGFDTFEVTRSAGQVKIEATGGAMKRELVYQSGTGRLLSDETHKVAPGSGGHASDDASAHAATGGHGSDDAAGDDHGGRTGGSDDHGGSGDDHGGSGGSGSGSSGSSGSGHDSGDDHGGGGGDDGGGHDSGDDHGGRY